WRRSTTPLLFGESARQRASFPLVTSQILIVPFPLAWTRDCPSGVKPRNMETNPERGSGPKVRTSFPLDRSQSVAGEDLVARNRPSGLNATEEPMVPPRSLEGIQLCLKVLV